MPKPMPAILHGKALSDLLPYLAVAQDMIVSRSPKQLTAVLEIRISEFDEVDVMQVKHDQLINVLNDVMPENSYVSIYQIKRFTEERVEYRTASSNEVISFLDKKMADSFNGKEYPCYACFMAITVPVVEIEAGFGGKRKAKGDEVVIEDYKETVERLGTIIHGLRTRIIGSIFRLDSQQILGFLSILINHKMVKMYSDLNGILIGDFNSCSNAMSKEPGYVYYGGNYHAILSLRSMGSESRLPSKTNAGVTRVFQKNDMREVPYTVHHSIKFIAKQKGIQTANLRRNNMDFRRGLAKRSSLFAKTPEGISPERLYEMINASIEDVENSNHRFVYQSFQVHIWHEEVNQLWKRLRYVRSVISSDLLMKAEKFNIKPAFFSLFPGNEGVNKINSMLATYTVGDFMPIDLPRECLQDNDKKVEKEHIFFETQSGSIARLCVFSTHCNAHNACVVGGTGSGKSFLMNSILYQSQAGFDPAIYIIDVGGEGAGSYMNFVLNNHGTYIQISADNPYSINPFDGPLLQQKKDGSTEPNELKFEALQSILKRMIGSVDGKDDIQPLDKNVEYLLNQAIVKYYMDTNNNDGNVCNLNDFAEKHLKDNAEIIKAGQDLYKALAPFIGTGTSTGIYAAYFRKTEGIRNPNIVCFDLMGLSSRPRLASVLVPTLLDMIMRNVGGKEFAHRRKLLVVDEAWKFLKDPSVGGFIQEMYSTIRKLNGNITILTQNLQTIIESPIAGSILINTSYYYLMGSNHVHRPEDNPPLVPLYKIEAKGKVDKALSEYDVEQILSQTPKRDFYVLTPFFCGQLRFYPTKEFIMLSTTHPAHKQILEKYKKQLGVDYVTPEVIEAAKHEF